MARYKVKVITPNTTYGYKLGVPNQPVYRTSRETSSQCSDFTAANNRLYSLTGGSGVPFTTTFFTKADHISNAAYDTLRSYFQQILLTDVGFAGTKIVLSNGSYILIDYVGVSGSLQFGFKYYNKDDVLCYNINAIDMSYYNSYQPSMMLFSIPWLLTVNNDYCIQNCVVEANQYYSQEPARVTVPYANYYPVSYALGASFWSGIAPIDDDDPYPDIPDSDDDPDVDPDDIPPDDDIDIPDVPDITISDSGFVTLFNPTIAQVRSLASYMWSGLFDLATFRKIFADPMDCILGFNIVPVAVPDGGLTAVKVGNISTGIEMTKAATQWVTVNCGSVNIGKPYDNYLDHAPYTKVSIYLPYIGIQELSIDDVAGQALSLVYRVDILSCACVAYLKVGNKVLYQFSGSCGYSIPLTGDSFRSMISNIVQIGVAAAGAIATGGASAPMSLAMTASAANNVMGLKPDVHRSGSIGNSIGLMGIQKPYLIYQFPNPCKPKYQYKYLGYPSFTYHTVGELSGYVEFENVFVNGLPCTEEEKQMVEDMLKGGAIV